MDLSIDSINTLENLTAKNKKMFNFKKLEIMSLENLNLQEMSHQEMKETEGGFFGLIVALFMVWVGANLVTGGELAP